MKKIMVLGAMLLALAGSAQIREGFVKYKTGIAGADDMSAAILGNSGMTIYFKKERSLTEMVTPLYSMRTLTDSKGTLMLMDGTGEKIFTRKGVTDPSKNKTPAKGSETVVTITSEKRKILGYDCVKATINSKDNTTHIIVWYTDKIICSVSTGFITEEVFKKINGLPLEIYVDKGPIKSKIIATELSVKPVADAVFNLSTDGYVEKKSMSMPKK